MGMNTTTEITEVAKLDAAAKYAAIQHAPRSRSSGMTLTEAAAVIGVTSATLRQQIKAGSLAARKVGRDWHVTPREVARYQKEHRRGHPG